MADLTDTLGPLLDTPHPVADALRVVAMICGVALLWQTSRTLARYRDQMRSPVMLLMVSLYMYALAGGVLAIEHLGTPPTIRLTVATIGLVLAAVALARLRRARRAGLFEVPTVHRRPGGEPPPAA